MPIPPIKTVESAIKKLLDTSVQIEKRMAVKGLEEKRLKDALALLATGAPLPGSKNAKNRIVYLEFLQRVRKLMPLSLVVLCAVALGQTAVANMKDRLRVDLPLKIKEEEGRLRNELLNNITETYCVKIFPQIHRNTAMENIEQDAHIPVGVILPESAPGLTGDIYELRASDATRIAEAIAGRIWLTDPYDDNTLPFVTIQVSWALRQFVISQRPKMK